MSRALLIALAAVMALAASGNVASVAKYTFHVVQGQLEQVEGVRPCNKGERCYTPGK